jgi:hypothetical protein
MNHPVRSVGRNSLVQTEALAAMAVMYTGVHTCNCV